jgi:hypothetical protein
LHIIAVVFIGLFRKIAKSDCSFVVSHSVCVSVLPHGTTRLPRDGFSWNLILEYIPKICQENSSLLKSDGYFTWRPVYIFRRVSKVSFFMSVSPSVLMERLGSHGTDFYGT